MNWVVSQGFTKDWALIELYDEKINWSTFKGNKVYIGVSLLISSTSSLLAFSIFRLLVFDLA